MCGAENCNAGDRFVNREGARPRHPAAEGSTVKYCSVISCSEDAAVSGGPVLRLRHDALGGFSIMLAALSMALVGVVGVMFVRRRAARKRAN